MNILNFSAYVFDLDGVIIDSEHIHYICYKKAFHVILNYNLNWEEYCRIHHSIYTSFEKIFTKDFSKIYSYKKNMYNNEINNIKLLKGFESFFNKLIENGKFISIVTDTSKETFDLICNKFTFLKKCNIVITRDDVDKRKPDNSCYIKLIDKIKNKIKLYDILAFEDSYKGWSSVYKTIYNCILVNNKEYLYYETINPENSIINFENILDYKYKNRFEYLPFYVSSKTYHREKWIELKKYYPIIANWININKEKESITINEKQQLCNSIQNDILNSEFGILYLEKNEKDHIGSLIEIGLLLAYSKKIYICGDNIFKNEVLFNFNENFIFSYSNNFDLYNVFNEIQYNLNNDYKIFESNVIKNTNLNNKMIEQNYVLDYIVICASGKGTRLLPITKHIPKLLVNIDNSNILFKIVNYWKKYSNKFVIIIDSKYNILLNFYLKLLNIDYEIINVDCKNGEENSYTLNMGLNNDKFIDKKILITWCDIYPETNIPNEIFDNKNIIFTYKNFGRYDAFNNSIIKKPYGNIIGIYYFSSFKKIKIFEKNMDICDCYLNNFDIFETFEIDNLIDIGDYTKLCEILNKNNKTYNSRFFNKILSLSNNIIEKKSICEYGDFVITNEMLFYKYHNNLDNIPKILEFGENKFKMQKISNSNIAINIFNNSNIKIQFEFLKNILNEIEKIHQVKCYEVNNNVLITDIKIEFYDKVLKRIQNITDLIIYFNDVKYVNNIIIKYDYEYIIDFLYKKIKDFFAKKNTYNTIHGDPHLSNILFDKNNKIWFIDPRGYFGNTKLFGLIEYDISKILYSLSGFDQINNNNNFFFIIDDKKNIIINIDNNMDNYLELFNNYDKDILISMTILHWFGLTDYSKNNIHKCISSYYYAIYLFHKYFL